MAKMLEFPTLRQFYNYNCGAATFQSVLAYYGMEIRGDEAIKICKTTKKDSTMPENIVRALGKYGLKCELRRMEIPEIKKFIGRGFPVIVLIQAWSEKKNTDWEKDWSNGHYSVIIGFDDKKFYFADPSSITRAYLTFKEFEKRWHDVDANGVKYINYGLVTFGKKKFSLKKTIHLD